jgi:LacI family transcriptional regulator
MTGAMELMNSGYQNIGLVTLVSKQVQMEDRKLGYLDALGTIHTDKRILEVPYNQTTEQNTLAIREFLLNNKTLDGMLFGTNYLAIAGLQAFKDLKLTVGKDIGVVGFDDNTNFALFTPSITAIAQPVEHIARCIVKEMVNALAKDPNWLPTTTILNTTLVKRESSTKL